MKLTYILALSAAVCSALPVVPSEDLQNKGITDIIGTFLPGLLTGLGQIAGAGFKTLGGLGLGLSAVPEPNKNGIRSNEDLQQQQVAEVSHVIAALTEGAMDFAKYAHLDDVAAQLAQISEELGARA